MMENSVKTKVEDRKIMFGLYVGFALLMIIVAVNLSVGYILDETGTIANAAYLSGLDWSTYIKATGGYYYKYGTAFLYFLPLKLISNSFWAYRVMVIINGLLYAFVPVITYYILRVYLKYEERLVAAMAAIAVGIVPSPLLFTTFARGDAVLISFSWIALFFIIKSLTSDTAKWKNIYSILATLAIGYIYMCHSRGVVWMIALVLLVAFMRLFYKIKIMNYIPTIGTLAFVVLLDRVLKAYFKAGLYSNSGAKHNTVGTFKFSGLLRVFSKDGLKAASFLSDGWMTSVIIGTVGIGFAGAIVAIIMVCRSMTKKYKLDVNEALINVYGFLTFVGSFALGILFFFNGAYGFVAMNKHKRADKFVYDRYTSVAYGIVVFIMIYYLIKNKEEISLKVKATIVAIAIGCIGFFHLFVVHRLNNVSFSARNAIGTATFINFGKFGNDNVSIPNLSTALQLAAVVGIVFLIIVFAIRTWGDKVFKNKSRVIVAICIIAFATLTAVNGYKLRIAPSIAKENSIDEVVEYMEELPDEFQKYPVYMSSSAEYIKELQMALKEYRVTRKSVYTGVDRENMFVLINPQKIEAEKLENLGYFLTDFNGECSYQIYVKGEKLYNELKDNGYIK